jgi:hypothetical protein
LQPFRRFVFATEVSGDITPVRHRADRKSLDRVVAVVGLHGSLVVSNHLENREGRRKIKLFPRGSPREGEAANPILTGVGRSPHDWSSRMNVLPVWICAQLRKKSRNPEARYRRERGFDGVLALFGLVRRIEYKPMIQRRLTALPWLSEFAALRRTSRPC